MGETLQAFLLALVLGCCVPWLLMRGLVPVLARSQRTVTVNHRGRAVFLGLGIVWLIWAGCAVIAGIAAPLRSARVFTVAGALALVAFALGMVDDAFGSREARGFAGHLRAFLRGEVTTGLLKSIGIGVAALFVASAMREVSPWGVPPPARALVGTIAAGAGIALTANLVNLMDLRPARALKSYLVLSAAGIVSVVAGLAPRVAPFGVRVDLVQEVLFAVPMLVGPVVAVWRDDAGERGMLGDAGANPAGVVAGLLIVSGLPLPGLLAYVVLVLVLNLLSERVSFSAVIERTAVLRWLDDLGRPSDPPDTDAGAR